VPVLPAAAWIPAAWLGLSLAQQPSALPPVANAKPEAVAVEEEFRIYKDPPRLLLTPQRLRLLRRERQRESIRWVQFETVMGGQAELAEPGISSALYGIVTERPKACRAAADFAVTRASDPRQTAIVLDWCYTRLAPHHVKLLTAKLEQYLGTPPAKLDIPTQRTRVFAAAAISETHGPLGEKIMRSVIVDWWRMELAPALRRGQPIPREHTYDLYELAHAIRDNLNIEIKEDALAFFKEWPIFHLMSYYPASYPAAENEFRIPFFAGDGEPDVRLAVRSRAADLALVAYDPNGVETQVIQGWLIQDRYLMKGLYGVVYEFLWANPYQPGLTYHHLPNIFHDKRNGRLFLRSNWDEDATFACYYDQRLQFFEDGTRRLIDMKRQTDPIRMGEITLRPAESPMKIDLEGKEPESLYLVGLKPNSRFDIEVDGEEMFEDRTDSGGILALPFKAIGPVTVRVHDAGAGPKP